MRTVQNSTMTSSSTGWNAREKLRLRWLCGNLDRQMKLKAHFNRETMRRWCRWWLTSRWNGVPILRKQTDTTSLEENRDPTLRYFIDICITLYNSLVLWWLSSFCSVGPENPNWGLQSNKDGWIKACRNLPANDDCQIVRFFFIYVYVLCCLHDTFIDVNAKNRLRWIKNLKSSGGKYLQFCVTSIVSIVSPFRCTMHKLHPKLLQPQREPTWMQKDTIWNSIWACSSFTNWSCPAGDANDVGVGLRTNPFSALEMEMEKTKANDPKPTPFARSSVDCRIVPVCSANAWQSKQVAPWWIDRIDWIDPACSREPGTNELEPFTNRQRFLRDNVRPCPFVLCVRKHKRISKAGSPAVAWLPPLVRNDWSDDRARASPSEMWWKNRRP